MRTCNFSLLGGIRARRYHQHFRRSIKECLKAGETRLATAFKHDEFFDAHFESQALLGHVMGINVKSLFMYNKTITPEELENFDSLLKRRMQGEPLQYILGFAWFYSLPESLIVNRSVLIPRSDSETVRSSASVY